ncbi:hypothetical protein GS982_01495 [Rhodococcus hoagii]|nr:hypothetical protein [Prescottella equi]NKZ81058.1 hypothetical protein [Prescottella equi]
MTLEGDDLDDGMTIEGGEADYTLQVDNDEKLCEHCSEAITHYSDQGWVHERSVGDARLCGPYDLDDVRDELELDEEAEIGDEDIEASGLDVATPADNGLLEHINWVGMTAKPGDVSVQISVGDPRGCFEMKIWKGQDEDGNPCLYLGVPHADMSTPHVPLERVHDGSMRIRLV